MDKYKVLLAEDDADFAGVLTKYLEIYGYDVCYCKDGEEALQLFKKQTFHICILDVMMPKIDGFTLAENMDTTTPFIFLTARKLKEDKIKGLQLGADDYIVKPFEVDELVLRLSNILKRANNGLTSLKEDSTVSIGLYTFDTQRLELRINDSIQQLTIKEAALIAYLYKNSNRILKRDEILKAIWQNDDFFSGRSMDVYISRLRKYFNQDPDIRIESTRHIGLEFKIPV